MASPPHAKISLSSNDSALSMLDLYSVPLTHTSVIRGNYLEVYPVDGDSRSGTIEFKVEGSAEL